MTSDLRTQVRDYTEFFVSTVESIDLDEITERPIGIGEGPVRPLRPLPPSSPRRRWLVAVAVAAAVLVLVGGAALLFRVIGSETPVATTPQIDSLSSLTWSRVPHDEAVFGGPLAQSMSDVTVGGPGLVAVGSDGLDAAVWTSPDGVAWSRVPHDEAVFSGAGISSVTEGGPGLVAVGGDGTDAVVWTSPDGVAWSRVAHDESVFGGAGHQEMNSVTAGGPGLVAVGVGAGRMTVTGEHRYTAAVWTSVDGVAWSRVPHDESVFGGPLGRWMSDVTVGGPGLVAVGTARVLDHFPPAVWISPDGITWSRVPDDGAVFDGWRWGMSGVTVGGPGLVAVGAGSSREFNDVDVWTSMDGITWSRVYSGPGPGREDDQGMIHVTAVGPGLVAVGYEASGGREKAVVWTSPDGGSWSRVPHNEEVFGGGAMWSAIAAGPDLVAVGEADGDGAVWVAVPGE